MNEQRALKILHEITALPTAPFVEQYVARYITDFVAQRRGLSLKPDAAGNLMVRYKLGDKRIDRPVCFTAHMDHPGFEAERMIDERRLRAAWRGGVQPEFFAGTKVRFYSGGRWVRGRVDSIVTVKREGRVVVKTADVDVSAEVEQGSPGMWDLPEPTVRGGRFHAPVCDDLAGAAAMLACMDEISRRRVPGEVYFLFTRAEEVGFVGAMAACKLKTIPKKCVVIAVENSPELPHARMGDGPILRVGDRATTFTSPATSFCDAAAKDLARRHKRFKYQRRLMDGGMCESTAYCALGTEATGVCLALGNYHNMDKSGKKIAPEFIEVDDFLNLAAWFVALVTTPRRYTGHDSDLLARLAKIQSAYATLLKHAADRR